MKNIKAKDMENKDNKKTFAFRMDVDTALEFFERTKERGAETEEERIKILLELANEGKMKNIIMTSRTKEQIIEDYEKHYNILTPKKPEQLELPGFDEEYEKWDGKDE